MPALQPTKPKHRTINYNAINHEFVFNYRSKLHDYGDRTDCGRMMGLHVKDGAYIASSWWIFLSFIITLNRLYK